MRTRTLLLVPFLMAAAPPTSVATLPTMTSVNLRSIPSLRADPAARHLTARTVHAYRLNLPVGVRITEISSLGGPLAMKLSNGRCIMVSNEPAYARPPRANRIQQTPCSPANRADENPPPPRAGLRPVNTSYGFTAWRDDRRHLSLITDAFKPQPLAYSTSLDIMGIVAFRYPDIDGADISIVARAGGKIFITLNEVSR